MNKSYSKIRHIQMVNENLEKRKLMEGNQPNWEGFITCLGLSNDFKELPTECTGYDQKNCMTAILQKIPKMSTDVYTKIPQCAKDNNITYDMNVLKNIPGVNQITDILGGLKLPGF